MYYQIKGFPLPPSVNALYLNLPGRGRCKSPKYRAYEESVRFWLYKNNPSIQTLRVILGDIPKGTVLRVDQTFYFQRKSIITKDGRPKKNDTSNRLKALHDAIAELIGIDDCYFWDGTYSKRIATHEAFGEYVDLTFSTMPIDSNQKEL